VTIRHAPTTANSVVILQSATVQFQPTDTSSWPRELHQQLVTVVLFLVSATFVILSQNIFTLSLHETITSHNEDGGNSNLTAEW